MLVHTEIEGQRLSDDEIVHFAMLMIFAGGETVEKTLATSTLRPCSAMTRTKISANDGWAESRVSPASKNTARNRAMRPSRGEAWEGRGVWGTTPGVYARCYWGGPKRSTRSFHKTSTLRSRSSRVPRLSTT